MLVTLATVVAVVMSGCASIWNAIDLAIWVKDRTVEQGCQCGTIELEEGHTETAEGNVWRGTCRGTPGNSKSPGITVGPVWTQAAEQPEGTAPVITSEWIKNSRINPLFQLYRSYDLRK
jgi:hypothetical protein